MKLDALRLGLTLGIVWAGAVMFLPIIGLLGGWGSALVKGIASLYIGYDATVGGTIIGMIWAFLDASIGGFVVAFVYNKLLDLKK